jgi:hypothetical protein
MGKRRRIPTIPQEIARRVVFTAIDLLEDAFTPIRPCEPESEEWESQFRYAMQAVWAEVDDLRRNALHLEDVPTLELQS